ncbi:hypothetical protein J2S74_003043 [Evansella vedderi]|uniref:Uncharacterized protein n=1 Tax=Evansella vedderi TaxID=38282 RepID=A0ABT9ZWQ6_9BACI|nr:hypothetical protein [Evansella vedderi]MDQ0255661.1 hypothetical protein [Evansella vedderi]
MTIDKNSKSNTPFENLKGAKEKNIEKGAKNRKEEGKINSEKLRYEFADEIYE